MSDLTKVVIDKQFCLYHHIVDYCGTDLDLWFFARNHNAYQGEGLRQWCQGWQDQYSDEPDKILALLGEFEKWRSANLSILKELEKMVTLLS